MYEYRKLSPQKRKEIVEYRKIHGYPLHAPPHPYKGAGYYLITAANYEHSKIMKNPDRRTEFELALLSSIKVEEIKLLCWVILPNHYHLVLNVADLNILSKKLKYLHGYTSYKWNKEDGLQNKRKVWYKYSDRFIRTEDYYYAAMNYVHYNPVKHGYCKKARDWIWSSLSLYINDFGKDWLINKWENFTPSDGFGDGWDNV